MYNLKTQSKMHGTGKALLMYTFYTYVTNGKQRCRLYQCYDQVKGKRNPDKLKKLLENTRRDCKSN